MDTTSQKNNPRVKLLLEEFNALTSERRQWETDWQSVRYLVRPDATDFTTTTLAGGTRTEQAYDSTAIYANLTMANGLDSELTPSTERWFSLATDDDTLNQRFEVRRWLEECSDILFFYYSLAQSNFSQSKSQVYMDLSSFGTGVNYTDWDNRRRLIRHKTFPLSNCWVREGADGIIDTIFILWPLSLRNIVATWGADVLPEELRGEKVNPNMELDVIHRVAPSKDFNPRLPAMRTNKPFSSTWMIRKTATLLEEGGFDEFPYQVPRWVVLAGQSYGRGAAITCLPDIRMLNQMKYTTLKGAQKKIDPTMIAESDSLLLPVKTRPGSWIFKQRGSQSPEPIRTEGDIGLGLEMMKDTQQTILRAFFLDWLLLQKNNKEMTAYETEVRKEEQLRLMAPLIGRQQAEYLEPNIVRCFNILSRNGKLPPRPASLSKVPLKVNYVSPAARAQMGSKLLAFRRYIEILAPFANISEEVFDGLKMEEIGPEIAQALGLSTKVLRTPEERAARAEERSRQQEMQQAAEMAKNLSGSVKDVAQAGML